jgi:acetolactate synthase regulatory subunit
MTSEVVKKSSSEEIKLLQDQIESLTKKHEQLKELVESINNKHESVMGSVLDHLVSQSKLLSQYAANNRQHVSSDNPTTSDQTSLTCTSEYAKLLSYEHSAPEKWGTAAKLRFAEIIKFIREQSVTDILDYGAGSANRLSAMLNNAYPGEFFCTDYDPAIPEISQKPEPHSLVTCIDVLEHVEPELLDNVLCDLKRVIKQAGFFVIYTMPAQRFLKNGKNAHLIVESAEWWVEKLSKYFDVTVVQKSNSDVAVIVKCI